MANINNEKIQKDENKKKNDKYEVCNFHHVSSYKEWVKNKIKEKKKISLFNLKKKKKTINIIYFITILILLNIIYNRLIDIWYNWDEIIENYDGNKKCEKPNYYNLNKYIRQCSNIFKYLIRGSFDGDIYDDDNNFENDFIYIKNDKSRNTIYLKKMLGSEIIDNNYISVYLENMKYLRNTSLNYSINQRSLSTEWYVYFRSFLKQAISPHSLTKAIKIDKEYIYPWDVITQDDAEKIIENAKFYGFLFTWFKNHRKAQKVNEIILRKDMPVLTPKFIKSDFSQRLYKNNKNNEPNFYGIHYTWLGHATGLVIVDGFKILVDPVFKIELLSLKGIARSLINWVNIKIMGGLGERISKSPCNISNLPDDLHAVFISHNHNDHIMEEDVRILCKLKKFKDVMWYVPEGTTSFFIQEGCKTDKIYELSWGDERWVSCWINNNKFTCRDGLWNNKKGDTDVYKYKIIYAPALHWSGRKGDLSDINQSLWGSLILKGPKSKFYFSGDTAYLKDDFEEFKKIGKLHGPFDFAAISIGAYEPNNSLKYHHIHPWESVKIWRDIRAEMAIGVHWGTFRLSAEEFLQPRDDLEAALLGVSLSNLRNYNLTFEKKKMEVFKKYMIKNVNSNNNDIDDLEDLKEYFYPASLTDYNEYTDSFHSIFSNNLSLFYSDIDKNYIKHMYQQKKLYLSTYNRYKRALILKNSKKLPKSWKKLLLNLSIRFQTIPIGGSIEITTKDDTISMTRSTEYNSTIYEHYTFPKWYKKKETEETLYQYNVPHEDLMTFSIVS